MQVTAADASFGSNPPGPADAAVARHFLLGTPLTDPPPVEPEMRRDEGGLSKFIRRLATVCYQAAWLWRLGRCQRCGLAVEEWEWEEWDTGAEQVIPFFRLLRLPASAERSPGGRSPWIDLSLRAPEYYGCGVSSPAV